MKKIAVVGTQGIPANYGGFESLVDHLVGRNCSPDVKYTVFCSRKDLADHPGRYKNARLKYVPLRANGAQSTPYDILSMLRCVGRGYDVVLVLGVSGCVFLPVFRLLYRGKIIVNIDGLEHRRAKWGKFAKWFLRTSESIAVKFADKVIADNKGIEDYVAETYGKKAALIAYGGDHVFRDVDVEKQKEILREYGIERGNYAISVCRIEPENNCHISLEALSHTDRKFVFIGNWQNSDYGRDLKLRYSGCKNLLLLDAIYDLDILYTLRSNAGWYIHGHSAGGTNPSLVEAMFFGCPILAYDVVYNRESTCNRAYYYANEQELLRLMQRNDLRGDEMVEIAKVHYAWTHIVEQYEALY